MKQNLGRTTKLVILTLFVLLLSVSHLLLDPKLHILHEFLFKATYLPIILAGLWFGWQVGLLTAFLTSILYIGHIYFQLFNHCTINFIGTYLDLFLYHVIGFTTGFLSNLQKMAHARAEKSYDKLKAKAEEILSLEKELEHAQRLRLMGEMVASVAHEIRTPLMSIVGASSALKDESLSTEEKQEFWEILDEGLDRINQRVSDFLNLSAKAPRCELTDLNEFFYSSITLLKKQIVEKNLKLKKDILLNKKFIETDPSLLQQIFSNILLNAIQASPEDKHLHIRARSCKQGVFFSIRDHGAGIPDEKLQEVFKPFYTTKPQGTGLGLAICGRIIRNLSGRIYIKSPGSGALIAVWIPVN